MPPSITITNPPDLTTVTAPTNISIGVAVADPFGTVTNVAFFANITNLIGSSASPLYPFIWTNPAPGGYKLTAVATSSTPPASCSATWRPPGCRKHPIQ